MDTQGRPGAAVAAALAGWNGGRAAVVAGAGACAVALGLLVAIAPDLLHFQPSTLDAVVLVGFLAFGVVAGPTTTSATGRWPRRSKRFCHRSSAKADRLLNSQTPTADSARVISSKKSSA